MSTLLSITDTSQTPPEKKQKKGRLSITSKKPLVVKDDKPLTGGVSDFLIVKEGEGRLYYRLGLTYSPKELWQSQLSRGFRITRKYEGADNPGEVFIKSGTTTVVAKAGCTVRITLKISAATTRYHVALVDYLPAGFEPINPAVKKKKSRQVSWNWFDHQQYRESRVEAFSAVFWPSEHTFTYLATAVSPGLFIAPPATAEEMYNPDIFGNSSAQAIEVVN